MDATRRTPGRQETVSRRREDPETSSQEPIRDDHHKIAAAAIAPEVRTASTDQSAGQPAYATVSNDHETDERADLVRQMTRTPQRSGNMRGTIETSVIKRLAVGDP